MTAAFDLHASDIINSIEQTIAWCATQPITATPVETEDDLRRRRLFAESGLLMATAYTKHVGSSKKLLRREYWESPEWKLGMELSRQANPLPIPLANQLRTHALEPKRRIEEIKIEEERKAMVRSVVDRRSALLRAHVQATPPRAGNDQREGRLLIYVPDDNIQDGASEYSSFGFYDSCDAPPWDTWIAYSDRKLLSWVPAELIGLAQIGIEVNVVECIPWLK
jgi:hypothetical protein